MMKMARKYKTQDGDLTRTGDTVVIEEGDLRMGAVLRMMSNMVEGDGNHRSLPIALWIDAGVVQVCLMRPTLATTVI